MQGAKRKLPPTLQLVLEEYVSIIAPRDKNTAVHNEKLYSVKANGHNSYWYPRIRVNSLFNNLLKHLDIWKWNMNWQYAERLNYLQIHKSLPSHNIDDWGSNRTALLSMVAMSSQQQSSALVVFIHFLCGPNSSMQKGHIRKETISIFIIWKVSI